jgi:hypothetical protein
MNISKTNWTLIVTIVIAIVNAVVPFMSAGVGATVTSVLLIIASIFHVSDVKTAVAQAKAPLQPIA